MAVTMDPATAALTTLAQSLIGIERQQYIESFIGNKDDNVEQLLKKFVAVAKLNGWWGNTELMPVQFLLHLKGTASDWYQENEEYCMRANWTDVESAFVERFKRSDAASAMDL